MTKNKPEKKPCSHIEHHSNPGFAACGVPMVGLVEAPADEKPGCDRCKAQSEKSVYRRIRRAHAVGLAG